MGVNYEKDIKIDESSLDVEWLEQPRLMIRYSQIAAETRKEADVAKERLDYVKAELDKDIRSNPDKYDITKITEGVVANTIILQSEYQEAAQEVIETKYRMEVARGVVQAINDRKEALENLVKLHGMSYFAGPSVPRDLSKEWEQAQKQKKANSKVKLKRGIER